MAHNISAVGNGPLGSFHVEPQKETDRKEGVANHGGHGPGGVGGKSSKARKHAVGRNSTPYARPTTGRHAAAGPSNAAALGIERVEDGKASSAHQVELARPLGNNGWWGRLSSIASGAAHLVTAPLGFFKADQQAEGPREGAPALSDRVQANGDVEVGPAPLQQRTSLLSALIEESVDGVELSEEEYERITQLLKSKTKCKRPLEANRRPDEVVGKQTVQEDSVRKQILKEPQDSPRVNLEERRTDFDKHRMMREKDEGELEYAGARGLQEFAHNQDDESPVQAALEFMNQARVPAGSADRSPESERSFSFPKLEGGRNVDSRSTGNGLQAFAEDGGAQYRTPAPRRGSVTSRPYTLQRRAGSVEFGEDAGTRWTPMRVPLSGGREMLKRRASQVDDGWQTQSLRRIRQRGLDEVEVTMQRRSFRQAVQATPAPSFRPHPSPTPSQPFTPGASARGFQSARRLPSLPPASQPPSILSRGAKVTSADRALSVRQEQGGNRMQRQSLGRTEMSKTASRIFETLDMMLSPQKLVGSNLSPEVLHDMSMNERARLSKSTLDVLPPVEPLRASPGRESPPALPAGEAFPPSTSADYQAATASAARALGNGPVQKSSKAIEGRKEEERKGDEERASGQAEKGGASKEAPSGSRGQATTEEAGRERGGKRSRTFKMSAAGLDDDDGGLTAGASIFPQPATQSSIFSIPATAAPAATLTTSMAPVTSASGSAPLFNGGPVPAFTFSPAAKKESFEALKEGADVKTPEGGERFGFKSQSDVSFSSSLVAKAEEKAPSAPTNAAFSTSFSGFTSKPLESAPATPTFAVGSTTGAGKPFAFMGGASGEQEAATPAIFSGFGAVSAGGKRKAEGDAKTGGDANGIEKQTEPKETEPAMESGLMGFLKARKSGPTEGDGEKLSVLPPVFGTGPAAALFGGVNSAPSVAAASSSGFGGVFSVGPSATKVEAKRVESNGDGTERAAKRASTFTLPPQEAPAKPSLFPSFAFSTASASSSAAQSSAAAGASTSAASGLFVFGQPPAVAPSTSAAPETTKPFAPFGAAGTSASGFMFQASKLSETPATISFGAPKASEPSPAVTFGSTKPATPAGAAPLFGSSGATFSGAFGAQSSAAFGSSTPAPAFGASGTSTPAFGITPATSAPSGPAFASLGTTASTMPGFSAPATTAAASAPFSFSATMAPAETPPAFAFGQNAAGGSPAVPAFGGFGATASAPVFGGGSANGPVQNGPPSPGSAMDDSGMAEEPAQPAPAPLFGQQPQPAAQQPGMFGFSAQPSPFPTPQNPFQQAPQQPGAAFGTGQPPAVPFGGGAPAAFGGFGGGPAAGFSLGSTGGEEKSGRVIRKAKRPVKKR